MSRAASPFAGRLYGVVRVTREWEMARSSFYYQLRIAAQPERVLRRRGPKTECSDDRRELQLLLVVSIAISLGEDQLVADNNAHADAWCIPILQHLLHVGVEAL